MKTYKQTFEIFDYARLFHKKMSDFYDQLYEKTEKKRIKMLLEYLSQHEKLRVDTLAKYEKEASNNVMNAWFKYVPENISSDFFENIDISSNMTVEDVVDTALCMNNCLVELYKGVIEETKIEAIKDVFNSLLTRIEQEEKELVRDACRLSDL